MNTVVILAAVTAVLLAIVVAECITHRIKVKKLNEQLETLQTLVEEFERNIKNGKLIQAQYVVTDADRVKYKTEKALNGGVRSKLLMNIVNDIFKTFGEPVRKDGKYDYSFRIEKV